MANHFPGPSSITAKVTIVKVGQVLDPSLSLEGFANLSKPSGGFQAKVSTVKPSWLSCIPAIVRHVDVLSKGGHRLHEFLHAGVFLHE